MTSTETVRALVDDLVARLAPASREYNEAWWELATTGTPAAAARFEAANAAYLRVFADPAMLARLRAVHEQREHLANPILRREVERAYLAYAANHRPPELIDRLAALEAEVERRYSQFRAVVDGETLSENAVAEILRTSADGERCRRVWQASKAIGQEIAPLVRELVDLRNEAARQLGWANFYEMQLEAQEIDPGELARIADALARGTEQPFRDLKARIDAELAEQFHISIDQLRPWHYRGLFFQDWPPSAALARAVEPAIRSAAGGAVGLAARTLTDIGLDPQPILARSDLEERPGKNQHAFCIHMDRLTDDVRVLANFRPDLRSLTTALHELGHGVYDLNLGRDLPWLLREAAHAITTEGIAMFMERLPREPDWLARCAGLADAAVEQLAATLAAERRRQQLIFVRWALVMISFERDLYAGADDLNERWWEYVSRFQILTPPESIGPEWASKIHLATAPVYYQNYLLGELFVCQLQEAIQAGRAGVQQVIGQPAIGAWLRTMFARGAAEPWHQMIAQLTGTPIGVGALLRSIGQPSAAA